MQYEIKGTPLPAVICRLEPGEQMVTEGGGMSWMSPNMQMDTTTNGGVGKAIGRMFSGDKLFQNIYTAAGGEGLIAFSSCFPGDILPLEIEPGKEYVCQKSAFLASTRQVDLSIFFNKKIGAGLFGGEGFIMQKLSGSGLAFIEIDGSSVTYHLEPGEKMVVSTGHLVMMSATCSIDVETVKGAKNILLGGEGLFNTIITGPGDIVVQTMPIAKTASVIARYIPGSASEGAGATGNFAGGLIGSLFDK